MKFIVDAHFPKRLATWLVKYGEDAIHTTDLPDKNFTSDKVIIQIAEKENRIVISKDNDFIQYRILHNQPERLLMVTTGNIINKVLLQLFEVNFPAIRQLFEEGKKVIEIDTESITVHE